MADSTSEEAPKIAQADAAPTTGDSHLLSPTKDSKPIPAPAELDSDEEYERIDYENWKAALYFRMPKRQPKPAVSDEPP